MINKKFLLFYITILISLTISCKIELSQNNPQPDAFSINIKSETGSSDSRIPYGTDITVVIDIESIQGEDFNNYVSISSNPGEVFKIESNNNEIFRNQIKLINGKAEDITVHIRYAFSDTRLWVEEVGFSPVTNITESACNDGIDNDNDGKIDYSLDPGCLWINDNTEEGGNNVAGVSDIIYVENPLIDDVQGHSTRSPLEQQGILVDMGELYVTRVTTTGFNVTDITGCGEDCTGGGFSSIFAYNFNTPANLRVCDKLIYVGGIIGDYYGYTELNFPSWEVDTEHVRPEPSEMTEQDCPIKAFEIKENDLEDNLVMESYESALVEIRNAVISREWVDCDLNGDGDIAYGTEEETCRDQCDENKNICTELSQYRQYGQFLVGLPDTNGDNTVEKIYVVTALSIPEFRPRDHAGETIPLITGTLKQFAPLTYPWIIEPRCYQDVRFEGQNEIEIFKRCVLSLVTGTYEEQ